MKALIAALVLVSSLGAARPARACGSGGFGVGVTIGAIGGVSILGAANVVTLAGSSVSLGRRKSSVGWGIGSLVVASVDVAGSTLLLSYTGPGFLIIAGPFLAAGAANLAVGIANVVLANRRERELLRVQPVPLVGLDSTGHTMGGVGIRFRL
jgi:hypothetical protein